MRAALRCAGSVPVRIFSVTGTATARTTALEDALDQRLIGQQRRAAVAVADLLCRTAHVDVDDLRAQIDVDARRRRQLLGSLPTSCTTRGSGSPSWSMRRCDLLLNSTVAGRR